MSSPDQLLKLRQVNEQDCELLWNWVNDPVVRSASFSSDLISWEDHVNWFNNKLNSPNSYIFIALNDQDKPIGQIRFDVNSKLQADIDLSINSEERGKNYASYMITLAVNYIFNYTEITFINAQIKSDNQASIKSFQKAGFSCVDIKIIRDKYSVFHYTFAKKKMNNYLVVCSKSWNIKIFNEIIKNYLGKWYFIFSQENFKIEDIKIINPQYIFFLHWSWKVPEEIINNYECVCFHMTDVPYGRGGSPLQNLIIKGHQQTKLTALRMTEEFDAGPVYLKENLSLGGGAEEIYIRASYLAAKMIKQIIEEQPEPIPQSGKVQNFKRRKPEQSEISQLNSLLDLHDFIRMLDAENYPKAFLEYQGFRYEFNRSALYNGKIVADVTITPIEEID